MTKRQQFIAFAGTVTAVALLAGCSSGGGEAEPTSEASSEGGTVTFAAQTQEQVVWEALIASFEEANPTYTVEAAFTPNDQFAQLIQTQFQAGQAADVIQVTPGSGGGLSGLSLAEAGRLADLEGQPWTEEVPEGLVPLIDYEDKTYVLPTAIAPYFVAYNPDLFDQVGVDVPTTFDDLLDACGEFADAGLIPITLAGASYSNVSITLQTLASNDVDGPNPEWTDERYAGDVTFEDSREWQNVLENFQDMIDARCYAPDAAAIAAPVHSQQFGAGQAAMYVMPAQALSIVAANSTPDLKVSSFPFPGQSEKNTWIPTASGIGVVVNADAGDVAAAKKFVEFLGEPEQRIAYSEESGGIAWAAGPDGEDVIPEVLEPLRDILASDHAPAPGYLLWPGAGVAQQLATSAQGLLTGQKTIEQVLADTDAAWDQAQ